MLGMLEVLDAIYVSASRNLWVLGNRVLMLGDRRRPLVTESWMAEDWY